MSVFTALMDDGWIRSSHHQHHIHIHLQLS
jgi:hypothetical protein